VETFHGFADRWASIEIIRHGPGLDGFRNERLTSGPSAGTLSSAH
jgi:predicted lipoprotein